MAKLKQWWIDKCVGAKLALDSMLQDERGEVNIIAIILIVIVVIALVVIFRDAIKEVVTGLIDRIKEATASFEG